jgi:uncharacterized protein YjiS (DUF1127 family)
MTYVSTHHLASTCPDETSVDRAQSTAVKLFYGISQWVRRVSRRRHLVTLGQMSDQQLADIGLYYHDIVEVSALGYDRDVTFYLAQVAHKRSNISTHSASRIRR